eukprot:1804388-Rhodomonas_salina.1
MSEPGEKGVSSWMTTQALSVSRQPEDVPSVAESKNVVLPSSPLSLGADVAKAKSGGKSRASLPPAGIAFVTVSSTVTFPSLPVVVNWGRTEGFPKAAAKMNRLVTSNDRSTMRPQYRATRSHLNCPAFLWTRIACSPEKPRDWRTLMRADESIVKVTLVPAAKVCPGASAPRGSRT